MDAKRERFLFVEYAGLLDIVRLIALAWGGRYTIYYLEYVLSKPARAILAFLGTRVCRKNFVPLQFHCKNGHGDCLQYSTEEVYASCFERFFEHQQEFRTQGDKMMLKSFVALALEERVRFLEYIGSCFDGIDAKVLYIRRSPLNHVIKPFYRNLGWRFKESLALTEYLKFYFRPLVKLMQSMVSTLLPKKIETNIQDVKPAVWVEYNLGEFSSYLSMTFWRDYVKAKHFDLVYYFDRADTPLDRAMKDRLEEHAWRWINLRKMFRMLPIPLRVYCGWLVRLCVQLCSNRPAWLSFFALQYRIQYEYYRRLFKAWNVRILIQHQDWLWVQQAQAKALEDTGGVMIGFHWSIYPCCWPTHNHPEHVYFVWGRAIYEFLERKGHANRHILPSGICIVPNRHGRPPALPRDDAEFILTLFDSSVSPVIHQTPEDLSRFLLAMASLIECHGDWVGLLKSKCFRLAEYRRMPDGELLYAKLQKLCHEARFHVLDPATPPFAAASLADLSVCFGINSAGVLSAVYGHHVIHWDCSGWLRHPFYHDRGQKIVYSALSDLQEAIEQYAQGDHSIGDFAKWRKAYNHFDDLDAPRRVGEFIQACMERIDGRHPGPVSDVLDKVVRDYRDRHNLGVHPFGPPSSRDVRGVRCAP